MNNENCHLVYGIDQKYVPPALVSIYSAIRSASGPLKITVFMTEDNAESIRYFQFLEKRFPENRIELSHFDPSPFEEYDRTRPHHWAAASMIPLFVPWLLEGTCIVLDADTVILDDITHLSQEDLRGNPLAACQASSVAVTTEKYFTFNLNRMVRPFYSRKRKQKICEWSRRVGFSIDELKTKYCASGVHVMRTDVIRKMDPKRDLANVEASRKHWNSMPDMDRYNEVFKDKTHLLDLRWNVYRDFNPINRMYVSRDLWQRILAAKQNPAIFHYTDMFTRKVWKRPWWKTRRRHKVYRQMCMDLEGDTGIPILRLLDDQVIK